MTLAEARAAAEAIALRDPAEEGTGYYTPPPKPEETNFATRKWDDNLPVGFNRGSRSGDERQLHCDHCSMTAASRHDIASRRIMNGADLVPLRSRRKQMWFPGRNSLRCRGSLQTV